VTSEQLADMLNRCTDEQLHEALHLIEARKESVS
jgi:hypothetical protein